MKYQAVLFDLDGTLLNTLQDIAESVNYGLKIMGFPQHRVEEYRWFVGEGRDVMASKALPEDRRDPETVSRLCSYINDYYTVHWADHTRPYPGIPELLDTLTARKVRLNVFSNKPHEFTVSNVNGLLSKWPFREVVGVSETTPRKPDCTAALRIASRLGLEPSSFIYLGDSGIDMQTAVSAGMYAAGALWGFRTAEELKSNGAQVLLEKPSDMLRVMT